MRDRSGLRRRITDRVVAASVTRCTVAYAGRRCRDRLAAAGVEVGITQRDAGERIASHDPGSSGDGREVIRLSCIRRAAVVHLADGVGRDRDRLGRNGQRASAVAAVSQAVVAGVGAAERADLLVVAASRRARGRCDHRGAAGLINRDRGRQRVTGERTVQACRTRRGNTAIGGAGVVHQPGQRSGRDAAIAARKAAAGEVVIAGSQSVQTQPRERVALVGIADVLVSIGAAAGHADVIAADLVADGNRTRNCEAADQGAAVIDLAQRARTNGQRGTQRCDREGTALAALAAEVDARLAEVAHRHRVVADRTGGRGARRQIEGAGGAQSIVKGVVASTGIGQGQRAQGVAAGAVVVGRCRRQARQRITIDLARRVGNPDQQRVGRRDAEDAGYRGDGVVERGSAGCDAVVACALPFRTADADGA